MAFLLRVALPDRPGSLGQLASALGTVGADIEAIEVVERRLDGTAVDDVLVGLPGGGLAESLVSACRSVPGVAVEWISRYAAGGGLFPDLEAVEVMTQAPRDATTRLVEVLPTVFHGDWAALLSVSAPSGQTGPLAVRHATAAAPELDGLPLARPTRRGARRLPVPEGWAGPVGADLVLAVAAVPGGLDGARGPGGGLSSGGTGASADVVAVGRRGGPEFLDSELARLFHLAALAASITAGGAATVDAHPVG